MEAAASDAASVEHEACVVLLKRHDPKDVERFTAEYEGYYEAACDTVGGDAAAVKRIQQLSSQLSACREELASLETYEEDAKATRMNREVGLDTLRRQFEEIQARKETHRAQSKVLYESIEKLREEVDRGPGWNDDQEGARHRLVAEMADLRRQVEVAQKEHDGTMSALKRLSVHLNIEEEAFEKRRAALAALEARQLELRDECSAAAARKSQEERQLLVNQEMVRGEQASCQVRQAALAQQLDGICRTETQLHESKESMEKYLSEYDVLFRTIQRLSEEVEAQIAANERAKGENQQRRAAIAAKEAAATALRTQQKRVRRQRDAAASATDRAEVERQRHEQRAEELREALARSAGDDFKAEARSADGLRRQLVNLEREREILQRKATVADKTTTTSRDLVEVNQAMRKSLLDEATRYRQSVGEARGQVESLLAKQLEHEAAAEAQQKEHRAVRERLQQQDLQAATLQRKIGVGAVRLKQQQNLYEAARGDRNAYSKDLVDVQDEIGTMRRRFKVMNHQIEQIKEEITAKDHALVKEHFHHHNVDKDREALRNDVAKLRKQMEGSGQVAANQHEEVLKLGRIVQEADAERQRQVKERDAILAEHRILTLQLTSRSEELAAAYDRVRAQVTELQQGEARYDAVRSESTAVQRRLASMATELRESLVQVTGNEDISAAKADLERSLLRERNKVRALAGELEQPLNVHRWRGLEASDPKRYELVCRMQALQSRLSGAATKLAQRDAAVRAQETLYAELRRVLARRPGPQAAEQLAACHEDLKRKGKQMRSLEEQLELYRRQVGAIQRTICQINADAQSLRRQWVGAQLAADDGHAE